MPSSSSAAALIPSSCSSSRARSTSPLVAATTCSGVRPSASRAPAIALLAKYGGDAKAAERGRMERSHEPARVPAVKIGLKDEKTRDRAVRDFQKYRSRKFEGKQGESDHHVAIAKPKWMLTGKRGNGKTDRR